MHVWECRRRDALFTICSKDSFGPGREPVRGTDEKPRRWSVRSEERSGEAQETKQQPTRTVFSLSCLVHTRLRFTRTGGRIGT